MLIDQYTPLDNNQEYLILEQWNGSCLNSESSLHQIAPYIGKMKSTMAKALIETYTEPKDLVLDPFTGSGTVGLECLIAGRRIITSDINPYAVLLTKAKIFAPPTLEDALNRANEYLKKINKKSNKASLDSVPEWVKTFFHPRTLQDTLALSTVLKDGHEYFLLACLLGILHHQRPGFLSYPSSHLVPYLRSKNFPKDKYPELYEYREIEPRFIAKIKRMYKRVPPIINTTIKRKCIKQSADKLKLPENTINAVITSPPYVNALDYARDNRLRLWFLGVNHFKQYDEKVKSREKFLSIMERFFFSIKPALKTGGKCILVIGEVKSSSKPVNTAELIIDLAINRVHGFELRDLIEDFIPDIRRARREGKGTKREWVVVLERVE